MASVDIINFENKCDYPDNYELQQHRRSSVAVEWYKKCITTASSTVLGLLGITIATRHSRISLAPYLCDGDFSASLSLSLLPQLTKRALLRVPYVCNVIVISVFKALQKHHLTTHDNYNYNFVIFAYTRPPY